MATELPVQYTLPAQLCTWLAGHKPGPATDSFLAQHQTLFHYFTDEMARDLQELHAEVAALRAQLAEVCPESEQGPLRLQTQHLLCLAETNKQLRQEAADLALKCQDPVSDLASFALARQKKALGRYLPAQIKNVEESVGDEKPLEVLAALSYYWEDYAADVQSAVRDLVRASQLSLMSLMSATSPSEDCETRISTALKAVDAALFTPSDLPALFEALKQLETLKLELLQQKVATNKFLAVQECVAKQESLVMACFDYLGAGAEVTTLQELYNARDCTSLSSTLDVLSKAIEKVLEAKQAQAEKLPAELLSLFKPKEPQRSKSACRVLTARQFELQKELYNLQGLDTPEKFVRVQVSKRSLKHDGYIQRIEDREAEIRSLFKDKEGLVTAVEKLKKTVADQHVQLRAFKSVSEQYRHLQSVHAEREALVQDLRSKLKDQREKTRSAYKDIGYKKCAIRKTIAKLCAELKKTDPNTDCSQYEEMPEELEKTLKSQTKQLKEDVARLTLEVNEKTSQGNTLQGERQSLQEQLSQEKEHLRVTSNKLETAFEDISSLQAEAKHCEAQLDKLQVDFQAKTKDAEALEQARSELEQALSRQEAALQTTTNTLQETRDELQSLTEAHNQLTADKTALEQSIENLNASLIQLQAETQAKDEAITRLETTTTELTQTLDEAKQENTELKANVSASQLEITQLKESLVKNNTATPEEGKKSSKSSKHKGDSQRDSEASSVRSKKISKTGDEEAKKSSKEPTPSKKGKKTEESSKKKPKKAEEEGASEASPKKKKAKKGEEEGASEASTKKKPKSKKAAA